jgi:hypothetical protein
MNEDFVDLLRAFVAHDVRFLLSQDVIPHVKDNREVIAIHA